MTESLEPTDGSDPAPTIPVRYVREMFAGHELPGAVLEEIGLSAEALASQRYRLHRAQMKAVFRELQLRGDDEFFGALVQRVPPGSFAAFARMATGCRDVRAMLEAANDWYGVFDQGHRHWSLSKADGVATLALCPRTAAQASSLLFTHVMLLSPWRTANWITGEPFTLRSVRLDARFADYSAETRFLFGCDPMLVDGPSAIAFESDVLGLPVQRTRDEAAEWTRSDSFAAMLERAPRHSLEARVRRCLSASTPFASAKLGEVATALAMAPPTLSRRMRELGTSFQQIKDRLRRDHAIALLTRGTSVAETAEALGFSEPSSFGRAFAQWTGTSPGAYLPRGR